MSFSDVLQNSVDRFDYEREMFLIRVSNKLLGKVKARTPVDTGQLRRSWQNKRISDTEREIINNTKYGPMVEYGHRTRGGKGFVNGRYMLTKSVEEISKEFDDEFEIFMNNLWE